MTPVNAKFYLVLIPLRTLTSIERLATLMASLLSIMVEIQTSNSLLMQLVIRMPAMTSAMLLLTPLILRILSLLSLAILLATMLNSTPFGNGSTTTNGLCLLFSLLSELLLALWDALFSDQSSSLLV
jgi:hypothetical protein